MHVWACMRACGYVGLYMHVCIVIWHDNPHPHRVVQFLSRCQDKDGGFAGGPGQLEHLAPTYAAVLSLCILGTQEAYDCIDR